MQVVFAHYHLNPGGVTQVILSQIAALATLPAGQRPTRIGVLYGARKDGWPAELPVTSRELQVELISVPELDYDEGWKPQSAALAERVQQALRAVGFAAEDTLLHIHNHALGKNISWPGAVEILADVGYRLLLQIHDFAEDFRPANYHRLAQSLRTSNPGQLARRLYPQAPSIHYATLTEKDAAILGQSGIEAERLSVLSNPATEFPELPSYEEVASKVRTQLGMPGDAKLVVYPVRGIRRKNVGELLLHSAISENDTWHAVTLAPRNPVEKVAFDRWRALAEQNGLRTLFNICGAGEPEFFDTLAASDWLITTSVAEGFGMVFLEAWLVGRRLVGRWIPGLTDEFAGAGLRFECLRPALEVPLAWISDREQLAATLEEAYTWACKSYDITPDPEQMEYARQLVVGDREAIDFALLPGKFQEQVVLHAAADPSAARAEIDGRNQGIFTGLPAALADQQAIVANAEVTRSTYSFSRIGAALHDSYQMLADAPVSGREDLAKGDNILRSFMKVERLHAIRFEE